MNLRRWIRAALVGVWFAVQPGCGEGRAIPQDCPAPWDSPAVREVEKEWQSLEDAYTKTPEKIPGDRGKDKYANLQQMTDDLFRKRLSDADLRMLAGSIPATPDGPPRDRPVGRPFVDRLAEFMAKTFVDSGDRDSLLRLLSARPPDYVGFYWGIEFYLVAYGGRLKDPILLLGEAYSTSRSLGARHDLAAAVRRGFAGLGIRAKNDADFVKQAMDWYKKEKDRLTVNRNYWQNEAGADRVPLFERTAAPR